MTPLAALLAAVDSDGDLRTLFVLIAVVCLGGAAYCAYLRNVLGAVLLVFVAVVALLFGT